MNSHFLDTNPTGNLPPLLLMHGLTGNAHVFDGLLAAGLGKKYRIIAPDLRGRGKSPKPDVGYTFADHAQDIIELLDFLGFDAPIALGGHSFGGFLAFYIARHFPTRVGKLVILDAAAKMPPETRERLVPTLSRLGQTFDDFDAYLGKMRAASYLPFWEESMLAYFSADAMTVEGKVTPIPQIAHIAQCAQAVLSEPLDAYIEQITQPVDIFFAKENYTLGAPLIPESYAQDTITRLPQARYCFVEGNHFTMVYGAGAQQIVAAL